MIHRISMTRDNPMLVFVGVDWQKYLIANFLKLGINFENVERIVRGMQKF